MTYEVPKRERDLLREGDIAAAFRVWEEAKRRNDARVQCVALIVWYETVKRVVDSTRNPSEMSPYFCENFQKVAPHWRVRWLDWLRFSANTNPFRGLCEPEHMRPLVWLSDLRSEVNPLIWSGILLVTPGADVYPGPHCPGPSAPAYINLTDALRGRENNDAE